MMLTLDETKSLVQILDPLWKAPDGLASALIVAGGVIGEDQEAPGGEIVGNIHVGVLSTAAETMSNDHKALGLVPMLVRILSRILISSQFLTFLGPEDAALHAQAREVGERISHPTGSVIPFSEGVLIDQNGSSRQNYRNDKNKYYCQGKKDPLPIAFGLCPARFLGHFTP